MNEEGINTMRTVMDSVGSIDSTSSILKLGNPPNDGGMFLAPKIGGMTPLKTLAETEQQPRKRHKKEVRFTIDSESVDVDFEILELFTFFEAEIELFLIDNLRKRGKQQNEIKIADYKV